MENTNFKIIYASEQSDQLELIDDITSQAWPEFMLHDPIANKNWHELYTTFADYQFTFADKTNSNIVAVANTIPLQYDQEFDQFPQGGWDWILQKGVDDFYSKVTPNIMSALQIVITPDYLGKDISKIVLQEMRNIAIKYNYAHLIAPVRPNLKPLYPIAPIEEYIKWKNSDGKQFDAWLRVHESVGGKIIKVCHEAMRIQGTIKEWESWAKMKFPVSGNYTVKGALVPISVDIEKNEGVYLEPNVLVVHNIK